MSVIRQWYCSCGGALKELCYEDILSEEDESLGEPRCEQCGASPSSDPRHTISFRDQDMGAD